MLPFAHKNRWTERDWSIDRIGTLHPRAPNLAKKDEVFCHLQSTRDQIRLLAAERRDAVHLGTEIRPIRSMLVDVQSISMLLWTT